MVIHSLADVAITFYHMAIRSLMFYVCFGQIWILEGIRRDEALVTTHIETQTYLGDGWTSLGVTEDKIQIISIHLAGGKI